MTNHKSDRLTSFRQASQEFFGRLKKWVNSYLYMKIKKLTKTDQLSAPQVTDFSGEP